MTFEVRRATTADSSAIEKCLREAFAPYRADYTPAAFADTVPDVAGIQDRVRTMTCLVACDPAGDVVGTISVQVLDSGEAHLRGMGVRPQWQGTDAASLLLSRAESTVVAAGCTVVSLDTTRPLARAIRFYERHGFVASGRVQDFFGMPLFEYRKALTAVRSPRADD